jgi:hypothetical protein
MIESSRARFMPVVSPAPARLHLHRRLHLRPPNIGGSQLNHGSPDT